MMLMDVICRVGGLRDMLQLTRLQRTGDVFRTVTGDVFRTVILVVISSKFQYRADCFYSPESQVIGLRTRSRQNYWVQAPPCINRTKNKEHPPTRS